MIRAATEGVVARRLRKCASSASSAQNSEQKWSPLAVRQASTERNGSLQNVQRVGLPFMRYLLLVTIRLLHRVKKQHTVFGHPTVTYFNDQWQLKISLAVLPSSKLCRQLQKSHNYAA
jgi:hypothetical protein